MRAWLYYRLSNDDNPEQNSLFNQREICLAYAQKRGFMVIGESSDDNASGMNFNRPGIAKLTDAAENGTIDAVIVKGLSRLGRHRTQTALFIDFLMERGVRVLSATEGLDSFREEDDLTISVRGLMNDYYAKDIGKKIRAGYRQKQKEGLVIIPPFGYWRDKNTDEIKIDPEAAVTVQLIFSLYLGGMGQKKIARQLNRNGHPTPAQLQLKRYGKHRPDIRDYVWSYVSVKNILTDESYIGVLINHQKEMREGKTYTVPQEGQFRHEGIYPPLVTKADWERVQTLLRQNNHRLTGGTNKPCHRYSKLLVCGDCGNVFVPMKRYWNGKCRIEYVCKGYHHGGKDICTSHRIHEEKIDKTVEEYILFVLERLQIEQKELTKRQKIWALRKPLLDAHISAIQDKIAQLEDEVDGLTMEMLNYMAH